MKKRRKEKVQRHYKRFIKKKKKHFLLGVPEGLYRL